jgi:glycosyltransferase involved in cell wall biosynthesis
MNGIKNPLVSVILINHNYGHFVNAAVNSVVNQTYLNIELIIVDDGSTDNSVSIIQQYNLSRSQVILLPENGGPSRSRNIGINLAKGDFIAFLDSDDYWFPDKVSQQIDFIEHNSLDGAYSIVEVLDIDGHTKNLTKNPDINFSRFIESPLGIGGFLMSTLLIHRSVLSASGDFDPELHHGEDLDFAARVFRNAKIECISVPLSTIRVHRGSLSRKFDSKFVFDLFKWTDSFLKRFGKEFTRPQRLKYILKTAIGAGKISIINKRPRLLFYAYFRIILLSRYLR